MKHCTTLLMTALKLRQFAQVVTPDLHQEMPSLNLNHNTPAPEPRTSVVLLSTPNEVLRSTSVMQ